MSAIMRACVGIGGLVILGICAEAQEGALAPAPLEIADPTAGTVVAPGQTITIVVSDPKEPLKGMLLFAPGLDVGGVQHVVDTPPYRFTLAIPPTTRPGPYSIRVLGIPRSMPPQLPAASSFPGLLGEVSIDVELPEAPETISTVPQCAVPENKRPRKLKCGAPVPLELRIGGFGTVGLYGGYSDGTVVDLSRSTRTTFVSESSEIATVTSEGLIKGMGPGSTHIVVNGQISVPVIVGPRVVLAPAQATLEAGQKRQFVARLTQPPDGAITWTLDPPVGSVVDGSYQAPDSIGSRQTVFLTAASAADPGINATAEITLSPEISVNIVPAYAVLYTSQRRQFTAGTAGVTWSINPAGAGVIDSAGIYTAPDSIAALQSVKVIATSATNPAVSASITIYISPRPFRLYIPSSTLRLAPGAQAGISVTLLASDRFNHPIELALAGLPAGVTATFSKPVLQGNNQTMLTFSAGPAAVPGTYMITVVAKDTVYPELVHSCDLTMNIEGRFK